MQLRSTLSIKDVTALRNCHQLYATVVVGLCIYLIWLNQTSEKSWLSRLVRMSLGHQGEVFQACATIRKSQVRHKRTLCLPAGLGKPTESS